MNVSVIVASFGSEVWRERGIHAALSVIGADQVVHRHEASGPVSRVRNEAADCIKDYLCFLDADDSLASGYFDAMYDAVAAMYSKPWGGPRCDGILSARGAYLPPRLYVPQVSYDGKPPVFPNGGGARPLIEINWAVIGTLIPAALFHELGGFRAQDEPYEDWSLWLRAVAAGAQLMPVPGAVYNASTRPESAHRTRNAKRRRELAETYRRIRAELEPAFA